MCVAVALLAGCGTAVAPQANSSVTRVSGVVAVDPIENGSNTPTTNVAADFFVERRTWGGLCPGGPCGTLLVIGASGAWTWRAKGKITHGTLSRSQVEGLVRAARATLLDRATGAADCAANHDGTSVGYAWTMGGATKSVSSCDHPINHHDSLAAAVDRIADAVAPLPPEERQCAHRTHPRYSSGLPSALGHLTIIRRPATAPAGQKSERTMSLGSLGPRGT